MAFTKDFILGIRPGWFSASISGLYMRVYLTTKGFDLTLQDSRTKPHRTATGLLKTERELWEYLDANAPWVFEQLATSELLLFRGLAERAELFLRNPDAALSAMAFYFEKKVLDIYEGVVESLGATVLTKARRVPIQARKSKNASYWKVASKVTLPYFSGEPLLLNVLSFPSPYEENVWTMHTRLPSLNDDMAVVSHQRLRQAKDIIKCHAGVDLEDVLMGTAIEL